MAESPEGSRLSGLARSIDALFSPPPAAPPATPSTPAPDGSWVPDAPDAELPPENGATGLDAPATWEIAPPAAESPQTLPGQDFDPLDSFESPWSEPGAGESGAPEPAVAEIVEAERAVPEPPAPESAGAASVVADSVVAAAAAAEPPPAASQGDTSTTAVSGPDEEGFRAAVDAWVRGDRSQRERIETLAAGLRDRLALDPLSDAVETLVRAAGDPPDRTFLALAQNIMNPAVASRLVQRMGRERDEARRAEYQALCQRLGVVMANGLKGALTGALDPAVRRLYRDTLISMGPVSRPIIEAMAEDENSFLVRDAVVMLGELGGERAVQLVTSALANPDARVREQALHVLGRLGDQESGRLALGFLEDPDSRVREAAAVAAGKLGLERALRPLLHLLEEEEDPKTRVRVLEALGDLGDPGAVPAIEKHAAPTLFGKTSTDVRVAAYKALHRIGTPHARELVQRAMNDKEPAVRAALRGLAREA